MTTEARIQSICSIVLLNEPVDNPASEMVFTNYALRNTLYGFELQVFVKCLY